MKILNILFALFLFATSMHAQQSIGMGTTTPHLSSILDMTSTTKGVLVPRMTYANRIAIAAPATGLMVYQTNLASGQQAGLYYYDGTAWKRFARSDEVAGGSWTVSGDHQYSSVIGNVGIGTSNPTSKFHLLGNFLQDNGSITLNNPSGIIQFQNAGVSKGFVQLSNDDLRLGTNGANLTGNVIFRMNGNDRIAIDTAGDMGIGTIVPHASAKLEIVSSNKGLLLPRLTTSQMFNISAPTEGLLIYNTDYDLLSHYDGNSWESILNSNYWFRPLTNRARICNNIDSVGIGTTAPLTRLHVANGSAASYNLNGHLMLGSNSGTNLALGDYEILARNNGAASTLYLQHEGGLVKMGTGSEASGSKLHVTGGTEATLAQHGIMVVGELPVFNMVMDGNEIQARNNGLSSLLDLQPEGGVLRVGGTSNNMYVNATGVGIGNNNPLAKLDVTGRIRVVQAGEAVGLDGNAPNIGLWYNGSWKSKIEQQSAKLYIQSNSRIHFDAFQVAIGNVMTTVNDYELTVTGKIICEEVKVELAANWPDYVFADTYPLRPIHELKAFVETHHHLPNIPKAAEVEKEGLELGEMNRRLLEKLEEHTLYIIQLQEQIDELKKNKE